MATTVKRSVLVDTYAWMTPVPDAPGRFAHNIARRGDEVEVSSEEAKRGEDLGALGSEEELARVESTAGEPGSASDEQIRGMKVDELAAYLGQHASEAERIAAIEEERDAPRKGVLDAVERVITTREEALASSGAPTGE